MVNKSSVFKSLKFYCMRGGRKISGLLMLLYFHVQLPIHIIHEQKLHFISYKSVCLFSMRNVYTQSFEYLNMVGIRAIMDAKLEEQRSIIKFLLLEGEKSAKFFKCFWKFF